SPRMVDMKALTSRYGVLCLLFIVLMVLNLNSMARADSAQGLRAATQATVVSAETLKTRAVPLTVSKVTAPDVAPVIPPVLTGHPQKNVQASDDLVIAINRLDAAGLAQAMKGIGPKKAEAIV